MLAPLDSDELDLRSNEVDVRRQQPQAGHDGRPDRLLGRLPAQDDVIDRGMEAGLLDTEAGRRVALRVEVDEKSWALGESKPGREIDGGGRLSDAALLVHDRDGPGHLNQSPARLNVPRRTLSNQHVFTLGAVFHGQHFPQSGASSQTFREFRPGRQLPGLVRSRTPGAQAGLAFRYTANRRVVPGRTPGSVTHSATEIGLGSGGPDATTTPRSANSVSA